MGLPCQVKSLVVSVAALVSGADSTASTPSLGLRVGLGSLGYSHVNHGGLGLRHGDRLHLDSLHGVAHVWLESKFAARRCDSKPCLRMLYRGREVQESQQLLECDCMQDNTANRYGWCVRIGLCAL